MKPISIFLLHRFQVLVDLLREALDTSNEIALAGIASNPQQAIDSLRAVPVDVVLLETAVDFGGVDFIHDLKRVCPEIKILPFGLSSSLEIVDLLESGACGYVPSEASVDDLLETVRLVQAGQAPCSSSIASTVFERLQELNDGEPPMTADLAPERKLTRKELQVLRLVAQGLSNRAIGERVQISLSTVKMHVHHILGKLEVRNRRQAVRVALEYNMLD